MLLSLHSGELTEEKTFRGINARNGEKSSVNNASLAQGHKLLFLTSIPGKSDLKNPDSEIKYIFCNLLSILVTGLDNAIWCGYHISIRVLVIMPTALKRGFFNL